MKENNNEEIKVGDIVKFKEDTYAINDVGRKENLYGALGMVIEMDYSIPGECFYTCAFSKDGKVVVVREKISKVDENKVQELHLADYFGEDLLKKYRGYRDIELPLNPYCIKHRGNPAPFKGKSALDEALEEELKMFKEKIENNKKGQEALSYQVGGSHYKDKAIQPVEYIVANKLDFLEGCIVKRITRHREKLGALDICKIRQECDLILQLEYGTTFEEVMEKEK